MIEKNYRHRKEMNITLMIWVCVSILKEHQELKFKNMPQSR